MVREEDCVPIVLGQHRGVGIVDRLELRQRTTGPRPGGPKSGWRIRQASKLKIMLSSWRTVVDERVGLGQGGAGCLANGPWCRYFERDVAIHLVEVLGQMRPVGIGVRGILQLLRGKVGQACGFLR